MHWYATQQRDACSRLARGIDSSETARSNAIAALNDLDWGGKVRAIRVNGADTHWAYDDVIQIQVVEGAGLPSFKDGLSVRESECVCA
ncbi:MAG TPA: hypothetical protein VNF29_00850 [Candidatus Binataceae bacterium]|nr:hypothetical protein [Candidatus Binataceae bacterium]